MSYLSLTRKWEQGRQKVETYGPGRPSPENARRPFEDRVKEAGELLLWLSEFYNNRVSILEHQDCMPAEEAQRRTMIETQATDQFNRWRVLG